MGIWTSAWPGLSFWTRWSKAGFGWKGLLPPFSRARPWLHPQLCFHIQVHETHDSTILISTVENLDWCYGLQLQASKCGLGTLRVAEVLSWGSWDQNYVYVTNNTKILFVFFTLVFSWVYTEFFRGYLMWDIGTDWMQKPALLITGHEKNLQKCKAMLLSYQIFLFWKRIHIFWIDIKK